MMQTSRLEYSKGGPARISQTTVTGIAGMFLTFVRGMDERDLNEVPGEGSALYGRTCSTKVLLLGDRLCQLKS